MFTEGELTNNNSSNSYAHPTEDESKLNLEVDIASEFEHPEHMVDVWEDTVEEISYDGNHEVMISSKYNNYSDTTRLKRKYSMKNRSHVTIFQCPYCNITVKYPSKIIEHLRIHSGERPFKCEMCGTSFTQSGALTAHIRSHSGDRPFSCHYCSRRFITSGQRSVYEKICNAFWTNNNCDEVCVKKTRRHAYVNNFESIAYANKVYKCVGEDSQEFTLSFDYKTEEGLPPSSFSQSYGYEAVELDDRALYASLPFYNRQSDQYNSFGSTLESSSHITDQNFAEQNDSFVNNRPETEIIYFKDEDNANWTSSIHRVEEDELHTNFSGAVQQCSLLESACYDGHSNDESQIVVENVEYEYVFEESQTIQDTEIGLEYVEASASPPTKGRKRRNSTVQEKVLVASDILRFATPLAVNPRRNIRKSKYRPILDDDDVEPSLSADFDTDFQAAPVEKSMKRQATMRTCEYCGRHLKYPSKIEAHMRTHTNEKPFKCTICGLGFAQNTTLRMHLRRHLNHKPFVCHYINCGQSFINGGLLNAHIQKKHDHTTANSSKEIAYQCGRCNNVFESVREFQKHEKNCCVDVFDNESNCGDIQLVYDR